MLPSLQNTAEESQMVSIVVSGALNQAGLSRRDVDFFCSGSCDYNMGRPFSFVMALDGIGAWPPACESHVEMDAAWALYEAWVHLQMGHAEIAVVYGFGKSSLVDMEMVSTQQLDPYFLAPLGVTGTDLAGMQAAALLNTGRYSTRDFAEVVIRSRTAVGGSGTAKELLQAPQLHGPLRAHDLPVRADGAAAVVLAAGPRACVHGAAHIIGIDHRIEAHSVGARDLSQSASTALAGKQAGVVNVDVAELHASYSHQEFILKDALNLGGGVVLNPSGGSLVDDIPMVSGLIRLGEAAVAIREGGANRAVAHASSGPCLQQNLVCLLEGGRG